MVSVSVAVSIPQLHVSWTHTSTHTRLLMFITQHLQWPSQLYDNQSVENITDIRTERTNSECELNTEQVMLSSDRPMDRPFTRLLIARIDHGLYK